MEICRKCKAAPPQPSGYCKDCQNAINRTNRLKREERYGVPDRVSAKERRTLKIRAFYQKLYEERNRGKT